MGRTGLLAGVIVGVFVLLSGAPAVAELIDDFEVGDPNLTDNTGTLQTANESASTAIGGRRHSTVVRTNGSGIVALSNVTGPNTTKVLSFDNPGFGYGTATLTYGLDGSGVGSATNNWDFTGDTHFLLDLVQVDLTQSGGNLVITAWNGLSTTYSTSAVAWPTKTGFWLVPFTAFSGTPDFSDVDRLRFVFAATTQAPDIGIEVIKTIPEPSTILLLLGGGAILGLAGFRRRRKK